ncbi:Tautomerase/MIF superfamily [Jimgerdemannia flammicorona]|uniref:L-dopachrome isomerase n=2 Tax=Jimgerdemannia flammicorona TaxID=994334 RepID=A0A433CYR3_9FUNG|nr:Tautomerase/MIF superfamily [Jimgerdemannia flammicorona]RUS29951.1 Tautomerase/MIF superfamily [Jimgerdemannia flammicorona]
MPSLEITANVAPKNLDEFVKTASAKFAQLIGKPESEKKLGLPLKSASAPVPIQYCLVSFIKADQLSFAGSLDPAAIVKIISIGNITPTRNQETSKVLSEYLESELGIPSRRFYIFFTDIAGSNVGFGGSTF